MIPHRFLSINVPMNVPISWKERRNVLRNVYWNGNENVTLPMIFKELSCPDGDLIKVTGREDVLYKYLWKKICLNPFKYSKLTSRSIQRSEWVWKIKFFRKFSNYRFWCSNFLFHNAPAKFSAYRNHLKVYEAFSCRKYRKSY